MAGREDLAPKGLDILTRDVSLDEIQSLFDITTGHDHDGTNSAIVSWNNIADKPSGLYYSLTAPTNEFTSSDDGVGNLTLSWKTQSAGLVLASPSASSGTPSFRSLIISDIPTITLSKLDNIASGSILGRKTALTGEVEALTITDIKTMLDVINYGVCTTDGATVNKTVDIANFALSLGTKVTVKFDNANSVSNPTLNVSSTGTKAIYNGSSAIDPAMLEAGKIYDFVYDGTNYVLISGSGSIPVNANSKVYVATPSQTEFSIAELYNINTVSVAVFRNGIFQLVSVDYTLDDTSGAEKIILSESCVGGETIVIQVNTTNATVDMSAHNHTFNELTDVSYYPNNHDTIVWNSTTSMWEPKPVSDFINSSSKSFTSIVGQVDFDVSDIYPTDYFNFAVFRNGLLQLQDLDYVLDTSVPGSEKVTLTDACVINEIIIVQFNTTNTKNDALDSYAPKNTPIVLKTESYTLALTDNYSLNKCLSASDIIITIPLNSNVAFPIGSELIFVRYGTGEVTFTPAVDVTLYSSGSKRTINMQYEFVTLKKMATDEWILLGSLG